MNNEKKKSNDIGAIWIKESSYGNYLSISVEINGVKHNFAAFPNQYKEPGDKKPDYRIPAPKQTMTFEEKTNLHKLSSASEAKFNEILKQKEAASNITESDLPF